MPRIPSSWFLCSLAIALWLPCGAQSHAQGTAAMPVYSNPVLWEDLPDLDILRVGNEYFYSASNMHYSPGAPILRSTDLVHWHYAGHSVPVLDFSDAYDLKGGRRAYVKGTWASFLGYRKSNQTFYWGGCVEFKHTYLYTAPAAEGPWKRSATLAPCYYDAGMLVDDDDTMYVAYGRGTLHVAQLSADAAHEVKSQAVFRATEATGVLEGSRFYKVGGAYYILTTHPADAEYVLRSTHGPFGPYEVRPLLQKAVCPVAGAGVPHQGGMVQTPDGRWFYMAFIDAYPGGRLPVLAPITWTDGWPSLNLQDNTWQAKYPQPLPPEAGVDDSAAKIYRFDGSELSPEWEWNHNPDNAKWALQKGLQLSTATVTDDLYSARNTLTHRIPGPHSSATIQMDLAKMHAGDRAGLVMLRDSSAWIGVVRDDAGSRVSVVQDITMDQKWQTVSKGQEIASAPLSAGLVWLRAAADIRPGAGRTAHFSYSTDGKNFKPLGTPFILNDHWQFFMGYRFGIFNYATKALGGAVNVRSFALTRP